MTNAESAQTNSRPIVTVQDNHLSNLTSDHWVPNEKKTLSKTTATKLIQWRNAKKKQKKNKTKQKEQS